MEEEIDRVPGSPSQRAKDSDLRHRRRRLKLCTNRSNLVVEVAVATMTLLLVELVLCTHLAVTPSSCLELYQADVISGA